MNSKKYFILITISIVIIIIATTAVTFAYISFNKTQTNPNSLTTSCFNLEFSDSASIDFIGYPMSSSTGLNTTPYSFNLKNICETPANYQIILNIKNNTDKTLLNYINYSLDGITVNKLSDAPLIELPPGVTSNNIYKSYIINEENLEGMSNNINYNLRLWIDENGGNDLMGKTFQAEVMIYSQAGSLD